MNEDSRRRDDILIAELAQKFAGFVDRYERDWKHTQNWREYHDKQLSEHTKILNEIAPNYKRGMWVLSVIVLGSLSIAIKSFWDHISFR